MPIVTSQFNDQKIILSPPFFAHLHEHQEDRDLHSHNCIEFSYILSGTADHILIHSDGRTYQQKLCRGNYMLLDTDVRHAYKNSSADFSVINLLFKPSFLKGTVETPSKGLFVTRSAWHAQADDNNIELHMALGSPQCIKDKKYLRIWLDLGGNDTPLDFGEAVVGVIADDDTEHPYLIGGEGVPFYFLAEGTERWKTFKHGKNGAFGARCASSVEGLRGWFAFPVGNMVRKDTGDGLGRESRVTGVFFRYNVSEPRMAGRYLCIDDVRLVKERYLLEREATGAAVVEFGKDIFRINVLGAATEEIKISHFDGVDFYECIRELFPEFKYSKIAGSPVNQIYFDRDGNVLPLFRISHECSRKSYHEWNRTVRHALSLILILSLQAFDCYIRPKKEGIIDTVKAYVEHHFSEDLTLTAICAKHFYSLPYVSHRFKEVCGCSFEQYVRQLRIKRAGELLLSTALSVSEIAERCGYTSPRSFRKAFICVTGVPPLTFKKAYHK